MAGVSGQNSSDDKLVQATGKRRETWHLLLDAEDATGRRLDDGAQVPATVSPAGGGSRVALTRSKLRNPNEPHMVKDAITAVLGDLASRADNSFD